MFKKRSIDNSWDFKWDIIVMAKSNIADTKDCIKVINCKD